ncbi:CD59A glycoprotein-like [Leucoraja erinacea]|uniref:CD59A glycoprotein-like n=1 Tax=Leucoraja erinaceus TaxID=7782 RepID=UPI002458A48A|nr:CD59A glycoprotein-like [Leucoraja erinacea]
MRAMEHSILKCLLFISLCSAFGSALECYVCESKEDSLCTKQSCGNDQDACLNVTFHNNHFFRRCWTKRKCNNKDVQAGFNIESGLTLSCCSFNLCNSKSGVEPGPVVHIYLLGLLSAFTSLHLCWSQS